MLCMILGSIQPSEDLFMIYHHMYQIRHVPYSSGGRGTRMRSGWMRDAGSCPDARDAHAGVAES